MLRNLRSYLSSIAIDGLLAAENQVKFSFQLLNLVDGVFQRIAGRQGIRASEGTVAYQIRLVSSYGPGTPLRLP